MFYKYLIIPLFILRNKCLTFWHETHKHPKLNPLDNAEHPQSYESGCSLCMHKPKSLALFPNELSTP